MLKETKPPDAEASPTQPGEKLATDGDVLGLLDYLEDEANPAVLQSSMNLISRCIRHKAKADLCGLCDDAFARIIGMATLLLARTQLYITERLAEAEGYGAHAQSGLPCDLLDQGWLERAERISRFISEMAAIRSRVQHVSQLNAQRNEQKSRPHRNGRRSPMDFDFGQDHGGEEIPGNGRFSCQEGKIEFP